MNTETSAIATSEDADLLLRTALDVAVGTLRAGGEIHRVEETVERICYAHGAAHVEVFAIYSLVIATVRMQDGAYASMTRRVLSSENHMAQLSRINEISRELTEHRLTLEEAQSRLHAVKHAVPYPTWLGLIGAFLGGGAFAVMFGGGPLNAIAAALIGLLMTVVSKLLPPSTNPFAVMVLSSLIGGVATTLAIAVGLGNDRGIIFVGMIMPLIPGLAFGNALRDLLSGDLLSGTLSLIRAVLLAASIAFGIFLSTALTGGLLK